MSHSDATRHTATMTTTNTLKIDKFGELLEYGNVIDTDIDTDIDIDIDIDTLPNRFIFFSPSRQSLIGY